jgi:hypothetical protein
MNHVRPFTALAAAAAAGFIAEGAIALVHRVGEHDHSALAKALNIVFAIGVLSAAAALPYVGRWLAVNRIGSAGVVAAQIGFMAMGIEAVTSDVHRAGFLDVLFFIGMVLVVLGTLALAITGLVAGIVRWAAPLPLLGWLIASGAGEHGGSIVFGAVWLVLAYAVVRERSAISEAVPV